MNYLIIKKIIEEILESHKCPDCGSGYSEKDIVLDANKKSSHLDLTILCPDCNLAGLIRADVQMEGKGNVSDLSDKKIEKKNIKDSDIITLSKKLNGSVSIKDIFQ